MGSLHVRLYLLLGVFFAIVFGLVTAAGTAMGIDSMSVYFFMALFFTFMQYMIGPKIIEWSMGVKYVQRSDNPRLFQMIEDLAAKAGIPMPRVGVSQMGIPNAFAFGRSMRDGRVCVTSGIMDMLEDHELRAVLGHEISHLKNRDVLFVTLLSVVPTVLYYVARHLMFYGGDSGRRRDRGGGGNAALIGLAALLLYFVTNLLVLYASRIREYFADKGSVELGNSPQNLASALFKLVYGCARLPKGSLQQAEGMKAFFINDPSRSLKEIHDLSEIDRDGSGSIDMAELQALKSKTVKLSFSERLMETFSTHPNMVTRIKALSEHR